MHKKENNKLTSVRTRDEKKAKNHTTFFGKQWNMLVK